MPRSKKDNVEVDSEEDEEVSMNTKLTQFISAISDKNYASAHKYLKSAVETKLVDRVNGATEQPLFKND